MIVVKKSTLVIVTACQREMYASPDHPRSTTFPRTAPVLGLAHASIECKCVSSQYQHRMTSLSYAPLSFTYSERENQRNTPNQSRESEQTNNNSQKSTTITRFWNAEIPKL